MQQRTWAYLCKYGESIRLCSNHSTLRSESSARTSSEQSGEGKIHLQNAANRQFVGGDNERSGKTAIARVTLSSVHAMIVGFPGKTHRCRQSITIVLPFIQGCVSTIGSFCDTVAFAAISLKTNKVRHRNWNGCARDGNDRWIETGTAGAQWMESTHSTKVGGSEVGIHSGSTSCYDAALSRHKQLAKEYPLSPASAAVGPRCIPHVSEQDTQVIELCRST
jgi:hypothetical protein